MERTSSSEESEFNSLLCVFNFVLCRTSLINVEFSFFYLNDVTIIENLMYCNCWKFRSDFIFTCIYFNLTII